MRGLAKELRNIGRMLATNPAMIFVAVLVAGLAVSAAVRSCRRDDSVLSGSWRVSRALHFSRTNAIWRGAGADRGLLLNLAYPRSPRKAKAAEKPVTPRTPAASAPAPAQNSCASLSDLRFPEFNLLIPPL